MTHDSLHLFVSLSLSVCLSVSLSLSLSPSLSLATEAHGPRDDLDWESSVRLLSMPSLVSGYNVKSHTIAPIFGLGQERHTYSNTYNLA